MALFFIKYVLIYNCLQNKQNLSYIYGLKVQKTIVIAFPLVFIADLFQKSL